MNFLDLMNSFIPLELPPQLQYCKVILLHGRTKLFKPFKATEVLAIGFTGIFGIVLCLLLQRCYDLARRLSLQLSLQLSIISFSLVVFFASIFSRFSLGVHAVTLRSIRLSPLLSFHLNLFCFVFPPSPKAPKSTKQHRQRYIHNACVSVAANTTPHHLPNFRAYTLTLIRHVRQRRGST